MKAVDTMRDAFLVLFAATFPFALAIAVCLLAVEVRRLWDCWP